MKMDFFNTVFFNKDNYSTQSLLAKLVVIKNFADGQSEDYIRANSYLESFNDTNYNTICKFVNTTFFKYKNIIDYAENVNIDLSSRCKHDIGGCNCNMQASGERNSIIARAQKALEEVTQTLESYAQASNQIFKLTINTSNGLMQIAYSYDNFTPQLLVYECKRQNTGRTDGYEIKTASEPTFVFYDVGDMLNYVSSIKQQMVSKNKNNQLDEKIIKIDNLLDMIKQATKQTQYRFAFDVATRNKCQQIALDNNKPKQISDIQLLFKKTYTEEKDNHVFRSINAYKHTKPSLFLKNGIKMQHIEKDLF